MPEADVGLRLRATTSVRVEDSVIVGFEGTPASDLGGAALTALRVLESEDLRVFSNAFVPDANPTPRYIGILDGAGELGDPRELPFGASPVGELASSGLRIFKNRFERVYIPGGASVSGIVLSQGNQDSAILNNAISVAGSFGNAIELERPRSVDVRHNTIVGVDAPDEGAALRVRLDSGLAREVTFASNIVSSSSDFFSPFVFESEDQPTAEAALLDVIFEGESNLIDITDDAKLVISDASSSGDEVDSEQRIEFVESLAGAGLPEFLFFGDVALDPTASAIDDQPSPRERMPSWRLVRVSLPCTTSTRRGCGSRCESGGPVPTSR